LFIAVLLSSTLSAAFEYPVGSVNSFALAGNLNLRESSPLDLYLNPALRFLQQVGVDLSLSRLYNMPDFDLASGAAVWNYRRFTLGVGSTQLTGSDYYWERSYLLSASTSLYRNTRVGVSANYLRVEFSEGYRSLDLLSFNVGGLWDIRDNLSVAASLHNLNRPRFAGQSKPLSLAGSICAAYVFSPDFTIVASERFAESLHNRFSLGQQINLLHDFSLRFGIASDPTEFGGGFSLRIRGLFFDYGFRDNVYLGGTHRFGLRYLK
jgi:hypothetical protein